MVREVRIHVEGGGNGPEGKDQLRRGFGQFFGTLYDAARSKRVKIRTIACGSRGATFDRFSQALIDYPQSFNVLLVDSEEPVNKGRREHLIARDGWPLGGTPEEKCHLMVQVMETWLIADTDALRRFYGQGFNANPIPNPANLESVDKSRVLAALREATRKTQKGEYGKIKHGSGLLAVASSEVVRQHLEHCREFFVAIESAISGP